MCTYHGVAKEVEPKILALSEAEGRLAAAERERAEAEARAAEVQATLDAARRRFEAALADKAKLEEDASNTRKRADAAESLLSALAGEEGRWQLQAAESARAVTRLTGDCLVAAAFLSYAGPFPREYRDRLVRETLVKGAERAGVPLTPDLKPSTFLVDEAEAGEWAAQGLPPDELSLQNGALVARAPRAPLLIDPQGQGVAWLLARESSNSSSSSTFSSSTSSSSSSTSSTSSTSSMRVVQPGERNFRTVLEDCLTTGTPLLIDWRSGNCDDLDPALDPVLEGRFVRRAGGGGSLTVTLGDRDVDVAPGFRVSLATPCPNPRLTPELCARVSAVDFTVTQAGLEDQLLARLVLAERRELERGRRALVAGAARERRAIKQLHACVLGIKFCARTQEEEMKSAGGEQTRRKKKRRRLSPFLFSLASARFDVFPPFLLIIMVGFFSTFYPVSLSSLID
jgi:dynein heavy chain, axonemal